jgi:hypothetical protein
MDKKSLYIKFREEEDFFVEFFGVVEATEEEIKSLRELNEDKCSYELVNKTNYETDKTKGKEDVDNFVKNRGEEWKRIYEMRKK